jgi:hypothetical protein
LQLKQPATLPSVIPLSNKEVIHAVHLPWPQVPLEGVAGYRTEALDSHPLLIQCAKSIFLQIMR